MASLLSLWLTFTATAAIHSNYAAVLQTMQTIASKNSAFARIVPVGVANSGRVIQALQIGSGSTSTLVVGAHHGNEYGSVEVALAVAESLALEPIAGQTVTVIPVLNIAGYDRRSRWESDSQRSRDPNRDYPGPCGTEGPFALKSTRSLADYIESNKVTTLATLHTYYPGVAYPWGLSSRDLDSGHEPEFRRLSELATVESRYPIGNGSELIYPADGTFEDYAFWKHGIWSLLFELGFSHSPSESEIETMKAANVPGIRRFLEQAPRQRAANHNFTGQCDRRLAALDRHDE